MAVSIRLRREGNLNSPYYKVVVADQRSPRDGKFIELVGNYDPKKAGDNFNVDLDRADYWIERRPARATPSAASSRRRKKPRRAPRSSPASGRSRYEAATAFGVCIAAERAHAFVDHTPFRAGGWLTHSRRPANIARVEEFLQFVIKQLVDFPEEMVLTRHEDSQKNHLPRAPAPDGRRQGDR